MQNTTTGQSSTNETNDQSVPPTDSSFLSTHGIDAQQTEVIQVLQEKIFVEKERVVTGKVKIRKTVSEELHTVSAPIINDEYEIVHVPMEPKTLMSPPPAVRQEGDTTIISVIREITVMEKRYEVIEEIHVTRQKSELPMMHEIMLKKEHVDIDRQEQH